jgi:parallel beta-helix repeat protein
MEIDTSTGSVDHNVVTGGNIGLAFAFRTAGPSTGLSVTYNAVSGALPDGMVVRDGSLTNSTLAYNVVLNSGGDGLHLLARSTNNVIRDNRLSDSGGKDAHDETTGSMTAGTANTWDHNECRTSAPAGLCS